jgi:hypothetical protein
MLLPAALTQHFPIELLIFFSHTRC